MQRIFTNKSCDHKHLIKIKRNKNDTYIYESTAVSQMLDAYYVFLECFVYSIFFSIFKHHKNIYTSIQLICFLWFIKLTLLRSSVLDTKNAFDFK